MTVDICNSCWNDIEKDLAERHTANAKTFLDNCLRAQEGYWNSVERLCKSSHCDQTSRIVGKILENIFDGWM